jgi:hypothetical protein
VLAFKIFIRSTLDYGIALNTPHEVPAARVRVTKKKKR